MIAEEILKSKLFTLDTLKTKVEQWKLNGEKIVFTNGCFDLLHVGHISYLAAASALGSKLVIGLNSDASTKRLKGPTRPVNDAHSRTIMLSAFFFIDAVVLFEEDTPLITIQTLLPNILVKGGDYNISQIVGAKAVVDNGGEVKVIDFVNGYSSTNIIEKIKKGE